MRKTLTVKIDANGKRDAGKTFILTEMPCAKAEKWAIKIFLALAHAGIEIPENIVSLGMAGLAVVGFGALSGLKYDDAEPILDEMMDYIQVQPDTKNPEVIRGLLDEDIEEIATRLKLRKEIFNLNLDFFPNAAA